MALMTGLPAGPGAAEAIATIAFVTALRGNASEAVALAERGLVLAREHGLADREVRCLNARGAGLLLQGDLAGYGDFMAALTRALEAGLSHESAMAYHNLADLHLQADGLAAGLELNQRGLELAERRGLRLAGDWLRASRVQLFFEAGRWDEALAIADTVLAGEADAGSGQAGTTCGVYAARIHLWRGALDQARELMATFLPRARQHAVIQQLGPALIVAGLVETVAGRTGAGAALASEFSELTHGTREYRQMDVADLVRLLVADGRLDSAVLAADNDVLSTMRNQCHSATARAILAHANGDADAGALYRLAAELWGCYGNPFEQHLASAAEAAVQGRGERARTSWLRASLGVSPQSVAALCPVALAD
jgi:tetratricopeptide (TPR) repeat protein